MKPSERIVQICKQSTTELETLDSNLATCMLMVQGICDYLDEEYEREQTKLQQVEEWNKEQKNL